VPGLPSLTLSPWSSRLVGPGASLLLVQGPAGPLTLGLPSDWSGTFVTVGIADPDDVTALPSSSVTPLLAFVIDAALPAGTSEASVTFDFDLPAGVPASELTLGYWDGTTWRVVTTAVDGDGPRVQISGSLPGPGLITLFHASEIRIDLVEGLNLVAWTARAITLAETVPLAPEGLVAAIFRRDNVAQTWSVHLPGAPDTVNTLAEVGPGDVVVIRASTAGVWGIPPW
jgi:hypothetical protein